MAHCAHELPVPVFDLPVLCPPQLRLRTLHPEAGTSRSHSKEPLELDGLPRRLVAEMLPLQPLPGQHEPQPADYTILLDESSIQREDDEEEPKKSSGSNQGEDGPLAEAVVPTAPSTRTSHRSTIEDEDEWSHFCAKPKKRAAKAAEFEPPASKRTLLWQKFSQQRYDAQIPYFEPRKNAESCEDYTEVFLSHARLYVFAEKYDVHELRYVALQKLQRTLAGFSLYKQRTGDISTLARYVYENTAERKAKADELRSLVVHYVACNIETLAKDELFRSLLKEGSITGDLVDRLFTETGLRSNEAFVV